MPKISVRPERRSPSQTRALLPSAAAIAAFRRRVWQFFRRHGRALPFRRTADPYAITVSEFMLQQTQVSRVVPKYEAWLRKFPDWQTLARASRADVLRAWSGLGYNRRALYLHTAARVIVDQYNGQIPQHEHQLRALPGFGPYTSRAVLIFAFGQPLAAIDTNIRRVLIVSFELSNRITDARLQALAEQVLPRRRARNWHYALMDYGALALTARTTGARPRVPQPKFDGSMRQVRGAIVRLLTTRSSLSSQALVNGTGFPLSRVTAALAALVRDGLVECDRQRFRLSR